MKTCIQTIFIALSSLWLFTSCSQNIENSSENNPDTMFQVATLQSLMVSNYDGYISVGELCQWGNTPGWHCHFISTDRSKGGHLLNITSTHKTTANLDQTPYYLLYMPDEDSFSQQDLSKDMPLKKVKVYTHFTSGVEELVLATDGYPRLFPTLEKTESYLQKCLAEDPLCIKKIKATKGCKPGYSSLDDRAYVRFKL